QKPHHDAFAVNHRDDGDADVDFAAVDSHLDPAVLRQTLFGDVEPGHNLEAADDRRLKGMDLRGQALRLQDAVDAVPDAQAVFRRLDVNVTRPLIGGLDEDLIHQLD